MRIVFAIAIVAGVLAGCGGKMPEIPDFKMQELYKHQPVNVPAGDGSE
jgi:hypothetical protein